MYIIQVMKPTDIIFEMGRFLLHLATLIIIWIPRDIKGCYCEPPRHPQNDFCRSEYVIVGKVLEEKLIPGKQPDPNLNDARWRYRIQIWSSLKGYNGAGTTKYVYTAGNGARCGIRLKKGTVYALGGRFTNSQREILSGDLHLEFKKMTSKQIIYLMNKSGPHSYRTNCNCQVANKKNSGTCTIPISGGISADCHTNTAVCRKRRESCQWFNHDCLSSLGVFRPGR